MSSSGQIELSLVIPTFNEEGNVQRLYNEILLVLKQLQISTYEVIFIDDGSSDQSLQHIEALRAQDTNVHYLQFSRNYGHQHALKAGLDHARGAAVVSLDADLQHPPALIADMVHLWRQGAEVVYTRRNDKQNVGLFKKLSAKVFYWLANRLSEVLIEEGTADFRLLDRKVVDAIKTFKESHLFLRGLIPTLGFKQVALDYEPAARFSGQSKYSLGKMFHFAINGITSSSAKPLYFSIYLGLFFCFSCVCIWMLCHLHRCFYRCCHYRLDQPYCLSAVYWRHTNDLNWHCWHLLRQAFCAEQATPNIHYQIQYPILNGKS